MTARIDRVDVEVWDGAPRPPAWVLGTSFIELTASSFGAHLSRVQVRGEDGWHQISTDYPPGPAPRGFHGATAGRWANRIAGARFALDGRNHELAANEGPNQLHGGPEGFDRRVWDVVEVIDQADRVGVVFALVSPDGDQGFPGRLRATARFEVIEDRLEITYEATTDEATVVNLTNHLYWNLAGPGTLAGHRLMVAADSVVAVDGTGIPLDGPPRPVAGTRFDCRDGCDLDSVVASGGYDHCFVLDRSVTGPQVRLEHSSGRAIEVTTDQIGCQIYTGQHLDPQRRGIAIESQRIPDAPNRADLGPSVLRPDERYNHQTIVRIDG